MAATSCETLQKGGAIMKSAKLATRGNRILWAGALAVSLLVLTPAKAGASAPMSSSNGCVFKGGWNTGEDAAADFLSECTPTTSGLFPVFNRNLVRPLVDALNKRFRRNSVGGPLGAYRRNVMLNGDPTASQNLARVLESSQGPGMAAGYTPHETTGQWIDRHLQPARDYHVNAWFNTSWSNPDDHFPLTEYNSDIVTATFGADMPIVNDDLIFGVFGSYTHSDVDSPFNNGGVDSDLGTLGPYVAYTVNQFLALDLTLAGVFGEHHNRVGPTGGGGILTARGDQDTAGFFLSANANTNYWVGNWGVQGRFGILRSHMDTDGYRLKAGGASVLIPGSDNGLTQLSLETQFNYFYDQGLPYLDEVMAMPFFRVTANFDVDRERIKLPPAAPDHPNDDEEVVLGFGVNLFGSGPLSGSLEASNTVARENFDSWMVSGTVNYAF